MAENKKDSFTFSDKIKNSKPVFNPFSKRVSSKIGNNGKPKKTLFERTKRDAPFLIAALAALLMLPFLYKYSGSVNEDMIVTPGAEDSVFDPERFGLQPSLEDPNGQIAQLTGSDSLSLIKGWGNAESATGSNDFDFEERDGLDDRPTRSYQPSVPQTTYRNAAPAATRAAISRQATKIKELGSASMNLRGGGGIGSRFGGSQLKAAAKQSIAEAPKQGVKPVSLQPLRAAGSPARSYFGQGSAAQARASRNALSKSDAREGLKEAMFNPIASNSRTLGGLTGGDFAMGGGAGKFDRNMNFKGITPWWWDMMKDREQKKWEWEYFLWRKNFEEPLIKALAEDTINLGRCLLWGNQDGDMDLFLGGAPGAEKKGQCNGITPDEWDAAVKKGRETGTFTPFGSFPTSEANCRRAVKATDDTRVKFEKPSSAVGGKGFFGSRYTCFGGVLKDKSPDITDRFSCEALDTTHNFELQTSGDASKWHVYHAVVAKNYVPFGDGYYLCGGGNKRANSVSAASGSNVKSGTPAEKGKNTVSNTHVLGINTSSASIGSDVMNERTVELLRDDVKDSCVIYVAKGKIFDWDIFKRSTIAWLTELGLEDENNNPIDGEKLFNALHLYFIDGYAMKEPLSKNISWPQTGQHKWVPVFNMPVNMLPIKYVDFETYYVINKGNNDKDKGGIRDDARNFATTYQYVDGSTSTSLSSNGKTNAVRTVCEFSNFRISAKAIDTLDSIQATLTFDPKEHGGKGGGIKVALSFPDTNVSGPVKLNKVDVTDEEGKTVPDQQLYTADLSDEQKQALVAASKGFVRAHWVATLKDKQSADDAEYSGSEVIHSELAPTKQCEPGTQDKQIINDCEEKRTCLEGGIWSAWEKVDPKCGKAISVSFFDKVSSIPQNQADLISLEVRRVKDDNKASKKWGSCQSLDAIATKPLLTPGDSDVQALLKLAAAEYNKVNKDASTLAVPSEENVTVANLLDAMSIVQGNISLNAVCMLGKTIGANSTWHKPEWGGNNMFGAFAAFMGPDSSFYPARLKCPAGQSPCTSAALPDNRFIGCENGKEKNANKAYHYGHYNWNWKKLGDQSAQNDREPFEAELAKGMWKDFPLEPIADAVGFKRTESFSDINDKAESMDKRNRLAYTEAYTKVLFDEGSCGLGKGTMSYENVVAYINALCQDGINQAPTNGNSLTCNRQFYKDDNVYTRSL